MLKSKQCESPSPPLASQLISKFMFASDGDVTSPRELKTQQKVQSISEHWARSDCLNFMQRDKFIGIHNYNCAPCSSAGNKHDFLHLFVVEEVIEWPDTFVLAKWVWHQVRVVTESRKAFINKQQFWVGRYPETWEESKGTCRRHSLPVQPPHRSLATVALEAARTSLAMQTTVSCLLHPKPTKTTR